jgi:Helix-turn-helix of DDE superfamily endonuclease
MKIEEFKELSILLEKEIIEDKEIEYKEGRRKRKVGGGAKGNLETADQKLFFVLYYMKNYPTYDVLGYLFDMDGGNACSHIQLLTPLVSRVLNRLGVMPERELHDKENFSQLIEKKELIIDATERRCVRPVNKERQKSRYSGKKKRIL